MVETSNDKITNILRLVDEYISEKRAKEIAPKSSKTVDFAL